MTVECYKNHQYLNFHDKYLYANTTNCFVPYQTRRDFCKGFLVNFRINALQKEWLPRAITYNTYLEFNNRKI